MDLPNFMRFIRELGDNDEARAQALNAPSRDRLLTPRTVRRYRNGQIPQYLEAMVLNPEGLRALLLDAEQLLRTTDHNREV